MLLADGINTVNAKYIPTAKNHQVAELYDLIGLKQTFETDGIKEYQLTLSEPFTIEDYYTINRL
jgi:predicted enzyme involved in methoxymalonyl-ACP biosynthesis